MFLRCLHFCCNKYAAKRLANHRPRKVKRILGRKRRRLESACFQRFTGVDWTRELLVHDSLHIVVIRKQLASELGCHWRTGLSCRSLDHCSVVLGLGLDHFQFPFDLAIVSRVKGLHAFQQMLIGRA